MPRPVGLAAVAAVIAVVAVGCGLFQAESRAQACATPSEGTRVADAERGFELCLPAHWRDLLPGDPGWQVIHGDDGAVEERVASGNIAHFAVPLEPRDGDIVVNLTVYVLDVPAETSLVNIADEYQEILSDMENVVVRAREEVTLPAGPAIRFTSRTQRTTVPPSPPERRVAYLFLSASRAYYFDLASSDPTGDDYTATFDAIAMSVRFLDPRGPGASPAGS